MYPGNGQQIHGTGMLVEEQSSSRDKAGNVAVIP
jgi:hypothetical protein